MGIEETLQAICLQCNKASHLGKKLLLQGLLNVMVYELDIQDLQKNDCWTCQKKVKQSFRVPASWKRLPVILWVTEGSGWQTNSIDEAVFKINALVEKFARYSWRVG